MDAVWDGVLLIDRSSDLETHPLPWSLHGAVDHPLPSIAVVARRSVEVACDSTMISWE